MCYHNVRHDPGVHDGLTIDLDTGVLGHGFGGHSGTIVPERHYVVGGLVPGLPFYVDSHPSIGIETHRRVLDLNV